MDTIMKIAACRRSLLTASLTLSTSTAHADTLKGWTQGKGFG